MHKNWLGTVEDYAAVADVSYNKELLKTVGYVLLLVLLILLTAFPFVPFTQQGTVAQDGHEYHTVFWSSGIPVGTFWTTDPLPEMPSTNPNEFYEYRVTVNYGKGFITTCELPYDAWVATREGQSVRVKVNLLQICSNIEP